MGGPLRERCRWWKDGGAASVGLDVGGARTTGAVLAMDEEDEDQMSLRRPGESGKRSEASLGLLISSSVTCSQQNAFRLDSPLLYGRFLLESEDQGRLAARHDLFAEHPSRFAAAMSAQERRVVAVAD